MLFTCISIFLLPVSWLSMWHQLNNYCLNGTCCLVFSFCLRVCFVCPFACVITLTLDFGTTIVFLDTIHRHALIYNTAFRRLDSVSVFRWNLLSWVQSIELVPISGHLHQHNIEYINRAQHKSTAYRHFFISEVSTRDVCDRPRLPSPWLASYSDYSPTAPAAPSLRPLIPRGSLMRCEPVQVNHHYCRSFPRAAG
jgi:hypothetical protein